MSRDNLHIQEQINRDWDMQAELLRSSLGAPGLRKLRLRWTCSDRVHHSHRWRWTAWLCGRAQRLWAREIA